MAWSCLHHQTPGSQLILRRIGIAARYIAQSHSTASTILMLDILEHEEALVMLLNRKSDGVPAGCIAQNELRLVDSAVHA